MREHHFEFGEFYALLLFATAGMMILAQATDLVTVFLGIETMSLAVYVLTGSWRHSPKASEGGDEVLPGRRVRHRRSCSTAWR